MAWVSTKQAAKELECSRQTLLRRTKSGVYKEGIHTRHRCGRNEYNLLTIRTPVHDAPEPPVQLHEKQLEAWNTLMPVALNREASGVMRITGYAGTGKTYLILAMALELQNRGMEIKFLAPTHSALSVIAKKAGEFKLQRTKNSLGTTICKSTGTRRRIAQDGQEFFKFEGSSSHWPMDADVVFIDEASMIGDETFKSISHCIENYLRDRIQLVCRNIVSMGIEKRRQYWSKGFREKMANYGYGRWVFTDKKSVVPTLNRMIDEELAHQSSFDNATALSEKVEVRMQLIEFLRHCKTGWPCTEQRVIFIGDPGQLPPINEDHSPALLDMTHTACHLDEVIRYEGSVLEYATQIRNLGDGMILPRSVDADLEVLPNNQWLRRWERDVLEGFDARIVTWTNAAVTKYVERIRRLMFDSPNPPSYVEGEPLISFGQIRNQEGKRCAPASTELKLKDIVRGKFDLFASPNWDDIEDALEKEEKKLYLNYQKIDEEELADGEASTWDSTWQERCQKVIKKFGLQADFLFGLEVYEATALWKGKAWNGGQTKFQAKIRLLPRDMYAKIGTNGFQRQCYNRLSKVDPLSEDAFVLKVMIECCRTSFTRVEPRSVMTAHRSQGSTFDIAYVDYDSFRRNKRSKEANKMLYTAVTRASKRVLLSHTPSFTEPADWDGWF